AVREYTAASLTAQQPDDCAIVTAVINVVQPDGRPSCLELPEKAFVVSISDPISQVFILALSRGRYAVSWSIDQPDNHDPTLHDVIDAWRADRAHHGGPGPYLIAFGAASPLISASLTALPPHASGAARFLIDGFSAQEGGTTVGEQASVWQWDGVRAIPL